MFTIEEAKVSKPTANYNIPKGATREFGHENIQGAVQGEAEAAEAQQVEGLRKVLKSAWDQLTGGTIDQTSSGSSDDRAPNRARSIAARPGHRPNRGQPTGHDHRCR